MIYVSVFIFGVGVGLMLAGLAVRWAIREYLP